MNDRGTRPRSLARDRWLRRLRRTFLAAPAAAVLAAVGLTAIFARHDALRTAPTVNTRGNVLHTSPPAAATSAQPGSDDGLEAGDDEGEDDGDHHRRPVPHPTTPAPSPTLTPSGTLPPITHTGGS